MRTTNCENKKGTYSKRERERQRERERKVGQ